MSDATEQVLNVVSVRPEEKAGGGYEGAQRLSRELYRWTPSLISPNMAISADKHGADSRSVDMVQNDALTRGAVNIHKDSIVGAQYLLNAKPNTDVLGAPDGWAEEFQRVVESKFNMLAESPSNWFDASRMNTFTGLIRLGVSSFCMFGEVLSTAEWIDDDPTRPFRTALQMIAPPRLSNKDGQADTDRIKSGVRQDRYGAPLSYFIRTSFPNDPTELYNYTWKEVPRVTPWGRYQVIHILEQLFPSEARGMPEMVSALKDMKMTKNYKEISLQNAVIQASYAAAIESELPSEMVYSQLGAGNIPFKEMLGAYLGSMAEYMGAAGGISLDGAKIAHLFPGSKLNVMPMGTPGGLGSEFEASLLRHIAAAFGLSYEELARDYTKTNYSSARAANANTERFMAARKKMVADRQAWHIYMLWLEEQVSRGEVPMPPGLTKAKFFRDPLMREAMASCTWIGGSKGQIDEKKETEAALMKINGGISTREAEIAKLGGDWRQVMKQMKREQDYAAKLGLQLNQAPNNQNTAQGASGARDEEDTDNE